MRNYGAFESGVESLCLKTSFRWMKRYHTNRNVHEAFVATVVVAISAQDAFGLHAAFLAECRLVKIMSGWRFVIVMGAP